MDRRQRKTRDSIFHAFSALLSKKDYNHITVGEIIAEADIGRATFYAHFETKDDLLKEFCEELFCHIFDVANEEDGHHHIFQCNTTDSVFVHLFHHLQKNDNNILPLLTCRNNALFLSYFENNLALLMENQRSLFESRKHREIPESFWRNHIISVFMNTLKWWLDHGMQESPDTITGYFMSLV